MTESESRDSANSERDQSAIRKQLKLCGEIGRNYSVSIEYKAEKSADRLAGVE
jgi:hypothetical protein